MEPFCLYIVIIVTWDKKYRGPFWGKKRIDHVENALSLDLRRHGVIKWHIYIDAYMTEQYMNHFANVQETFLLIFDLVYRLFCWTDCI